MAKWAVEYHNDVGPGDDGFWEWWAVTDQIRSYRAETELDAKWLCDRLNALAEKP